MTVRPALERSSATTLWIRAHCSACAPGGVSQRSASRHGPTAPRPGRRRSRHAEQGRQPRGSASVRSGRRRAAGGGPRRGCRDLRCFLALCSEGPIRVDSLDIRWTFPDLSVRAGDRCARGLIGNDGGLEGDFRLPCRRNGRAWPTNQFLWSNLPVPTSGNWPVKRPAAPKAARSADFTGKCHVGDVAWCAASCTPRLHCDRSKIMV